MSQQTSTSSAEITEPAPGRPLNSADEIVDDIRRGRMVVIMDDEDRENEGDLVMAAEHAGPEHINFMARYGRGLICLTLTPERCRQLRLPLMVSDTDDKQATNFTVSIEAASGITTGISAADRAHTVQTAVRPDAGPDDITSPGHVFPLMAQRGGVLTRAGHTETGCDLAHLAGLEPAAVIVEILNEDGSMARRPDLERFARDHDLKIGTVADLIRYRMAHETTEIRRAESEVDTEFGRFRLVAYEDIVEQTVHLALVRGEIDSEKPTLVRVHVENTLGDVVGARGEAFGWPLRNAIRRVAEEGEGVVVILRKPESPEQLLERVEDQHAPAAHDSATGQSPVLRTYGSGAQILKDLGVRRMRVLSAPKRMHGISGFGLEVVDYVECD